MAAEAGPRPGPRRPLPPLAQRRGVLVTVEGLWGAGKTTIAGRLGSRLTDAGFDAAVLHYGERPGVVGRLSRFLDGEPLRSRTGRGGYREPHHAAVDVLLRWGREAYHHRELYVAALRVHDVVVIDHGVYSKLAYALAVLVETRPHTPPAQLLDLVTGCAAPWFVHPDLAVFLDAPWPLARERAVLRGRGGGDPGSVERLLFLPRYAAAYRDVLAAHDDRVHRVPVGARGVDAVFDDALAAVTAVLGAARPVPARPWTPTTGAAGG